MCGLWISSLFYCCLCAVVFFNVWLGRASSPTASRNPVRSPHRSSTRQGCNWRYGAVTCAPVPFHELDFIPSLPELLKRLFCSANESPKAQRYRYAALDAQDLRVLRGDLEERRDQILRTSGEQMKGHCENARTTTEIPSPHSLLEQH